MKKLTLGALALILTTALIVAGCGGDDEPEPLSTEDYSAELVGILEPLGTELQRLGDVTREGGAEQLAANVGDVEEVVSGAIEDLEAIEPPEEAASAHDDMIAALQAFQEATSTLLTEAEETDGDVSPEAQQAYVEAGQQFQADFTAAATDLEAAGISLAPDTGATP